MPKRTLYTVCTRCGGWVYDWKLERSGGWCNECQGIISAAAWDSTFPKLDGSTPGGANGPPWRKGQIAVTLEQKVAALLNKFESGTGNYKVSVDLHGLRPFNDQVEQSAPKKPKGETPKSLQLRQAINRKECGQRELDQATSPVCEAEQRLNEARVA